MAVIPYTVTHLGNKRLLAEWLNFTAAGDSGQPFDASGMKFESFHVYNNIFTGTLAFPTLHVSNEAGSPIRGCPAFVPSSGISAPYLPYRWFFPIANTGGLSGDASVSILFKEE